MRRPAEVCSAWFRVSHVVPTGQAVSSAHLNVLSDVNADWQVLGGEPDLLAQPIVRSWSMMTIGGSLVPQVCPKQNCPGLPPSEMTPADQDLEAGSRTHSGRGTGWWKPQGGNYGHTPSSEML